MKIRNLIPLIPASAVLAAMFVSHSCANTTQAPTGGPKDTIPPTLIGVSPMPGTLNVPVHKTQIEFKFDEYVTVKDPKSLFLSPPPEKPLKFKMKGKSLVIFTDDEDLLPNTTYSIDITGAVADNNEGNLFPGFVLTFSTGERIDSMYITGIVQDCSTLQPMKGATVMLYKDAADSAIFKHRPDAAVKTDDWGYFCMRNIQDTTFRLYALDDINSNNMYDPETERVAFCDSAIVPVNRVGEDIYELYKFDMLDTAACLKRAVEYELNLFRGVTSKQMIVNKERIGERTAYVTFLSPFPQVDTVWFKGISPKRVLKQFNQTRDSLVLWINNPKPQADTLFLNVKYMKTDTTGQLVKTVETIKLAKPKVLKSAAMKSSRKNLKHEDTIAVYKVNSAPETFEQYGFNLAFDYPLVREAFDSIKYEITNPRQKVEKGKYTWHRDTSDLKVYHIQHVGKILPGYEYKFTIPERKFRDINGFWNDSTVVSVKLPDDDKLSKLTLELSGVQAHYIVDMMDEKKSNILRSYIVDNDCSLSFPYLKEGSYYIRITEDKNNNNMVDTGDLLTHKQPEKVKFFKLSDGNTMLAIPASTELTQEIDIKAMFEE